MRDILKQFVVKDKEGNVIDKFTLFIARQSNRYTIENKRESIYDGAYNGTQKYKECLEDMKLLCSMMNNGNHVVEIR